MMRYFGGVSTVFGITALPLPALAQQDGPHYGSHMWGGPWAFAGPVMMIVLIAAVVVGVIFMVRWLGGTGHGIAHHPPTGGRPLDILKERYAGGEIDKDEFEERRRVLGD